jgi:hypothetical protein
LASGVSPVYKEEYGELHISNEAMGCRIDELRFDSKQGKNYFSLLHRIHCEAHPTSCPKEIEGYLRGAKAPEA